MLIFNKANMTQGEEIGITWLGQGGFLFESEGERLLIDPFLSDVVERREGLRRLIEPPLSVNELKPSFVFITHDHIDHFDPIAMPEIHRYYPEVLVGGPDSVMKKAEEFNFCPAVLVTINKYESFFHGRFKITATPAFHSDPYSVGCLLEIAGKVIYISGDSLYFDTLAEEVQSIAQKKIDVVLICINGKLGNMDWQEAIRVVKELKPPLAIPMHYGMFAENTADPIPFVSKCVSLGIKGVILEPGIRQKIR